VAVLVIAGLGVAVWVALADGKRAGPDASDLSARELAGERLVAGFNGRRPPDSLKRMIRKGRLAGVILFSGNLGTRQQTRDLVHRLQGIHRPSGLRDPLLVMIDQEGGLVKRLPGPPNASAEEMGRRGMHYSRRQGARTARSLKGVGVNVDLAPVLDVGRHGSAIRAEHRSFGSTAHRVKRTGVRFGAALERNGVSATGKHFPGLGAAAQNTDFAVQRIHLSKRRLRRVDENPYRAFIARGGDLVMLSTAIYTRFSDNPAAFSARIATGELRDRLGFEGVSITDALQTASVRDFGGPSKAAVAGARAGTDLLLFTDRGAAARAGTALRRRLRSGDLGRGRFEQSVQRVLDLRARLGDG
jgi:beta-N-acetylhexosaminidase